MSQKKSKLDQEALAFHANGRPGKLEITATKPLMSQHDLSLAYSPGVAAPCLAIEADPDTAYDYTAKGNVIAVISNGTAVLGLGDIGAAASKPVMEGKAVLFKKFADIDGLDLEVDTKDTEKFVEAVAMLAPSFGASISRTSSRRNVSSSSSSFASASKSRSSMTTSTAPPSLRQPA
jgi:malate dehydrogenase (oxaloacetate-decarboxylating)(NADP+)